jgi:hypothetical protein
LLKIIEAMIAGLAGLAQIEATEGAVDTTSRDTGYG